MYFIVSLDIRLIRKIITNDNHIQHHQAFIIHRIKLFENSFLTFQRNYYFSTLILRLIFSSTSTFKFFEKPMSIHTKEKRAMTEQDTDSLAESRQSFIVEATRTILKYAPKVEPRFCLKFPRSKTRWTAKKGKTQSDPPIIMLARSHEILPFELQFSSRRKCWWRTKNGGNKWTGWIAASLNLRVDDCFNPPKKWLANTFFVYRILIAVYFCRVKAGNRETYLGTRVTASRNKMRRKRNKNELWNTKEFKALKI